MEPTPPLSRRTALLGLLGTVGLAAAGCTPATPAPTGSVPPTPMPSPTGAVPSPSADTRPRWPLNGKLLKDPDDARHAPVAVKVPDNRNEHPQRGLDDADIVFVQLDGYRDGSGNSGTRLMPVFHSKLADGVGPVRSIRPVDIPLLSPMHALIGNTGATGWVLNYAKAHSSFLEPMLSYMNTKGTGSYSIDSRRVRVYQGNTYYDRAVVCHPKALSRRSKKFRDGPPQIYFPFGDAADASTKAGEDAVSIKVPWHTGSNYAMGYSFDEKSGRYRRSMPWGPHVLSDGTRVATDNVLVIKARQHYAKIHRGGGPVEPIHDIIDTEGEFFYFHAGQYVGGTWSKGSVDQPFQFSLDDGSPLSMAPGQTYVELARTNAKVSIKG